MSVKSQWYWYKVRVSHRTLNTSLLGIWEWKEGKNAKCLDPQLPLNASHVNNLYSHICMGKKISCLNVHAIWKESSRGHTSPPLTSQIRSSFLQSLHAVFSPRKGVLFSPRLLLGFGWFMAGEQGHAGRPALRENKTQTNFSGHCTEPLKEGRSRGWAMYGKNWWGEDLVREHHRKCSVAEEWFRENGHPLSVPHCLCLVFIWGLSLLSLAMKAEPPLQKVLSSF